MPKLDFSIIARRVGLACSASVLVLVWRPPVLVLCAAALVLAALATSEVASVRATRRRPHLTLVAGTAAL